VDSFGLGSLSQIPRSTIEEMLSDIERRFLAYVSSMAAGLGRALRCAELAGRNRSGLDRRAQVSPHAAHVVERLPRLQRRRNWPHIISRSANTRWTEKNAANPQRRPNVSGSAASIVCESALPMLRVGRVDEALHCHKRAIQ